MKAYEEQFGKVRAQVIPCEIPAIRRLHRCAVSKGCVWVQVNRGHMPLLSKRPPRPFVSREGNAWSLTETEETGGVSQGHIRPLRCVGGANPLREANGGPQTNAGCSKASQTQIGAQIKSTAAPQVAVCIWFVVHMCMDPPEPKRLCHSAHVRANFMQW